MQTLYHKPIRRLLQVVHDDRMLEFGWRGAFQLGPIARPHEQALFQTRIPAAFQVEQFITDHVTMRQIQPKLVARVEQELRRRFASAAGSVWRLWRNVDFLKADT